MAYPQMPSIGVCLSWRPRSSGRDRECCCRIEVVLNHILLVNLFYIKDGLGGVFSLDFEVDIILMVSCLSKLSVGYYIGIKSRDKSNLF
jgi:hypothetical protein